MAQRLLKPKSRRVRAVRYRFQGRERSAATGLTNFRMRWYDTETGRWLSKDPIGLSGGLNLYAFCGDDVLVGTDPLGCFSILTSVVVVAGVIVVWTGAKIILANKRYEKIFKRRNHNDLVDVVQGILESTKGLLGDIISPFGGVPDVTSPITDTVGGYLIQPFIDGAVDKVKLPHPRPRPCEDDEDDVVKPLN